MKVDLGDELLDRIFELHDETVTRMYRSMDDLEDPGDVQALQAGSPLRASISGSAILVYAAVKETGPWPDH